MGFRHLNLRGEDHRRVWRLAWPMILSGLSTPLLGMVDTAVMGHLPDARFLAAVAVGAMVVHFLFWAFGFLRMATTGLAAQAAGAGDGDEVRTVLARAWGIGLGAAVLLLLLQVPLAEIALHLVGAGEEVMAQARLYFDIRIWAAPAALANYALWGWFIGLENPRAPLAMMLVINGANALLDFVLVFGLGLETAGVAWASLAAEYLGFIMGLLWVARSLRVFPGHWRRGRILNAEALAHLVRLNVDIFIRTMSLLFAFAFFTAQGARLGAAVLAANAVLMNFQTFMAYGLDGFAHAAESLVGRAVGARDRVALRRAMAASALWSLLTAVGFALVYLLAGDAIIGLLTDLPGVRRDAGAYLPWLVLTPLVSVGAFWLDGVFIGATQARAMRNAMLASVFLIYLPSWYLLRPLGNDGLWLALLLFMGARALTLGLAYRWLERIPGGFARGRA